MNDHEKELIEQMLRLLIDEGDLAANCARTAFCSVGLKEPIEYAITDARLSLASAHNAVLRANAIVAVLLHIRDKEKD
jgi:hypothetical protein